MNFLNLIPKLLILFLVGLVNCRYNNTRTIVTCALFLNRSPEPLSNEDDSIFKSTEDEVAYYLFEKTEGQIIRSRIYSTEESLNNSKFNFNLPTKIITHGFRSSLTVDGFVQIIDAFLNIGGFNVIGFTYKSPILYSSACKRTSMFATYLAGFINYLQMHGMSAENTTLIGHSLGAHIMGMAASKSLNKINFIVGLDPAGPYFETWGPDERLSPDDANTVYVIHSNEGHCGISEPIGHYDFYPNGGKIQPGCWFNTCAHSRSVILFADSIRDNNNLYGRLCPDLDSAKAGNCDGDIVQMSGDLRFHDSKEGIYHLKTRETAPFGLGP